MICEIPEDYLQWAIAALGSSAAVTRLTTLMVIYDGCVFGSIFLVRCSVICERCSACPWSSRIPLYILKRLEDVVLYI